MVPLAPAVRMSIDKTIHPCLRSSFIRGVYLLVLRWILSLANRSLVYVNSMNCILMFGSEWRGGVPLYGMPWAC